MSATAMHSPYIAAIQLVILQRLMWLECPASLAGVGTAGPSRRDDLVYGFGDVGSLQNLNVRDSQYTLSHI